MANKQQRHDQIRKKYNLEGILKDARNKVGNFPSHYMKFGLHATTDELEKIYNQLLIETDKDILLRLLWVFRRAPLPRLDEFIFSWTVSKDNELRVASINALAQISDERIHDLAITKIKVGELLGADNDILNLFLNNFDDDDSHLITQALFSVKPDIEDAHSLSFSVRELSKKHGKVELADALRWAYENTPCSICRDAAIEQLHEWQQLGNVILYECQFDAYEEIRKFAKENIKASDTLTQLNFEELES